MTSIGAHSQKCICLGKQERELVWSVFGTRRGHPHGSRITIPICGALPGCDGHSDAGSKVQAVESSGDGDRCRLWPAAYRQRKHAGSGGGIGCERSRDPARQAGGGKIHAARGPFAPPSQWWMYRSCPEQRSGVASSQCEARRRHHRDLGRGEVAAAKLPVADTPAVTTTEPTPVKVSTPPYSVAGPETSV